MFGRQNVGTVNPFQQLGAANPFQQFGAVNPIQQAAAVLSGRCPTCGSQIGTGSIFQQQPASISPLSTILGGVSQQPFQTGGFGQSPFGFAQTPTLGGINPLLNPQIGGAEFGGQLGMGQINPLAQPFSGAGPFGGQLAGQLGAGVTGQWGEAPTPGLGPQAQQAFGGVNPHILAQLLSNPAIASHPIIGSLIAQQLNPLAYQQPPIRSLVSPQQFNPLQAGAAGGFGQVAGQGIDPYSALAQAQLMSQLVQHPLQAMIRAYTGSPWGIGAGLPSLSGQTTPFAQTVGPFGV
jgi:hypothetical protein